MENDLQADTETLMQICTDTLVRNLRLWRVQETRKAETQITA